MPRSLLALALAASTIAACSTAAPAPSPVPTGAPPVASPRTTPTPVPGGGGGGGGGTDPGQGGGSGGATLPDGITFPIVPPGPDDTLLGQANYLTPTAGLRNQHAVNVQLVRVAVADDGRLFADLRWWSGVAPCNQLDSVSVATDEANRTIRLTVIEGSAGGDIACIEIAELHATAVDLGTLASGSWTVAADGDAPAVGVDIP